MLPTMPWILKSEQVRLHPRTTTLKLKPPTLQHRKHESLEESLICCRAEQIEQRFEIYYSLHVEGV